MSLTKMYVIVIALCFILFAGCCGSSSSSATQKVSTPQSSTSYSQPTSNVAEPSGPVTAGLNQNLIVDSWLANAQVSVDECYQGEAVLIG